MQAVLVTRYHDDEPGSPWTYALSVDARGTEAQRSAMADIFTGRLGGTARKQFPWVFKDAHLLDVEALEIEIDHTPGRGWFRAGSKVEVRAREPVPDQETVTCVIPGHHRPEPCHRFRRSQTGRLLTTESTGRRLHPLAVRGVCA